MTDYTQLLHESESLCELYEALQACQRERDELAVAIWGEPQPGMTTEETRRQAVDQRIAFDAIDEVKAERDAHAEGHLACSERLTRRIAELERERDELAVAIWGEPQPCMTVAETCRQAVDQRVAFDAIDAVKAERDRLVILCDRDKTWLDLVEELDRAVKDLEEWREFFGCDSPKDCFCRSNWKDETQRMLKVEQSRANVAEAERDRLAAEVEKLRAKLTCPECGLEIHAAHSLECSHERTGE